VELEPNNLLSNAQPLNFGKTISGVLAGGDVDFFNVFIPRSGILTLTITPDTRIQHRITNFNGSELSAFQFDESKVFNFQVTAQNYYVGLYEVQGRADYEILTEFQSDGTYTPLSIEQSPGTNCKVVNTDLSMALQSRESGLTNTELEESLKVTCPIIGILADYSMELSPIKTAEISIALKANNLNAETKILLCSLSASEGASLSGLESKQVSINPNGSGMLSWDRLNQPNDLVNYTITCDLPPQTAITSIETQGTF